MSGLSGRIVPVLGLGWFVATTAVCGHAWAEEVEVQDAHAQPAQANDASPVAAADNAASVEAAPGHGEARHPGEASQGAANHGEEAEEAPKFEDINWIYGFLGEEEGAEPSLLVRPKGMGTPFLATLINWGILVGLIVMMAKKQLPAALAKRKAQIVQGMEEAAKMLADSKVKLEEFDAKLTKIDSEIERIKSEMARAGELERERILAEAVERRVRMERDSHRLIETELEAARESLRRFVVEKALANAKQIILQKVQADDQSRFFDEALSSLKTLPSRSLGGQS